MTTQLSSFRVLGKLEQLRLRLRLWLRLSQLELPRLRPRLRLRVPLRLWLLLSQLELLRLRLILNEKVHNICAFSSMYILYVH